MGEWLETRQFFSKSSTLQVKPVRAIRKEAEMTRYPLRQGKGKMEAHSFHQPPSLASHPTLPLLKQIHHMSQAEFSSWLTEKITWLEKKYQREQAYIPHSAQHSTDTRTSEAYLVDGVHEQDLLALLRELEQATAQAETVEPSRKICYERAD